MKVNWRTVFWYSMVVTAWVVLIDSGWLVLWGPGASWHQYFFVLAWGALTLRRVLCDLASLKWCAFWRGWETGVRAATGQAPPDDEGGVHPVSHP